MLTLADSTTVWLVRGREGVSSTGGSCAERGVELRKGTKRTLVPLFYTRVAPRVEQGKLYGKLSNGCVDIAEYVIDPATAYPTPARTAR